MIKKREDTTARDSTLALSKIDIGEGNIYMFLGEMIEDTPEYPESLDFPLTLKKGDKIGIIFREQSFYYSVLLDSDSKKEGYVPISLVSIQKD